ncbi:hypothetical protein F4810DRAFT_684525 [Camillea tinctor]|nr:hypothetical protein F4810DRAFT_684525 [Camillea tinctor]
MLCNSSATYRTVTGYRYLYLQLNATHYNGYYYHYFKLIFLPASCLSSFYFFLSAFYLPPFFPPFSRPPSSNNFSFLFCFLWIDYSALLTAIVRFGPFQLRAVPGSIIECYRYR